MPHSKRSAKRGGKGGKKTKGGSASSNPESNKFRQAAANKLKAPTVRAGRPCPGMLRHRTHPAPSRARDPRAPRVLRLRATVPRCTGHVHAATHCGAAQSDGGAGRAAACVRGCVPDLGLPLALCLCTPLVCAQGIALKSRQDRRGKGPQLTAGRLAAHNDSAEGDGGMQAEAAVTAPAATASAAAAEADPMDAATPAAPAAPSVKDCFAPVRQKWNSMLESDREACAVLAAIDEVLKAEGSDGNVTAYWAALMSYVAYAAAHHTSHIPAAAGGRLSLSLSLSLSLAPPSAFWCAVPVPTFEPTAPAPHRHAAVWPELPL